MTHRTSRQQRTIEAIVETDRRIAVQNAEIAVIDTSCELAPLSYADLRALPVGGVGVALVDLADELVRPQAIRLLVERGKATGRFWGWGDVDTLETWLRGQIAAARAAQLAAQIGTEQAERLADFFTTEGPMEPETTPDPDGGYTLPAPALVRDVLARLATTAQAAGDAANANAFNRADYQISRGIYPMVAVSADGALLVPSKETAGTVYRVGGTGCSCTAGANGRPCWHAALAEALAVARDEVASILDDDAAYADSLTALDPHRYAA
jgi:hypothetical protein